MSKRSTHPAYALPYFSGSRLKLRRAKAHADALQKHISDYASCVRVTFGAFDDDHQGRLVLLDPAPPEDIALIIGDCIHNLRSALDLAIFDISRKRNLSSKNIYFPFAESANGLEIILQKNFSRLGSDVVETLRSLKPHRDGNPMLRLLHDLDIDDKHKLLTPAFSAAAVKMDPARIQAEGLSIGLSSGMSWKFYGYERFDGGGALMLEDEATKTVYMLLLIGPEPHTYHLTHGSYAICPKHAQPTEYYLGFEGTVRPHFPEDHYGVPGQPVLHILAQLHEAATDAVDTLSTRFN